MRREPIGRGDSRHGAGGRIPGSGGAPAYTLTGPSPSAVPVVIAVPHAGRSYTDGLIERMRHPQAAALKLEDRFADKLAEAVAAATGAALLVAHAPRAMLDLNRAADDVDWEMVAGDRDGRPRATPSRRARSGLGLIPRRLPGLGELWKRPHDEAELAARITGIHEPYHARLAATLADVRERWGAALLVDLHSMPPLALRGPQPAPEFVLGDRFGASCHGALVGAAFAFLARRRRLAAHNRPYAGGYVLERHADPGQGVHALQIEVDRASYLDAQLSEPGSGFASTVEVLTALVRHLAAEVASLGGAAGGAAWAEAAE